MVEGLHIFDIINILNSSKTEVSDSVTQFLKDGPCLNELGNSTGYACTAIAYGKLSEQHFKPCQYDISKRKCPLNKYPNKKQ